MTKAEIVKFVKDVRIEHDVKIAEKYVAKETGKGLSTNDYTNTEKTKLSGIAEGAQVNVIESVSIKGGAAGSINTETKVLTLDLDGYAKADDISAAFNVKGSKDTFAELPASNNKNGDVWNIKIAGGTDRYGTAVKAGDNVVYVEDKITPANSGWDVLGGTTDLSGYVETVSGKSLIYDSLISGLETLIDESEETFDENDIASIFSDEDDEEESGGGE